MASTSAVNSGTASNRPAKKRRTDSTTSAPGFKSGDWVITKKPSYYQRSNRGSRAVVQLEHPTWDFTFGERAWAYTTKSPTGEEFSTRIRESNLTRFAVVPGDEVKTEGDGLDVIGIVGRVYLDGDDEMACEVHYAREERIDNVKKAG